jgi:RHS repeat-associated protein
VWDAWNMMVQVKNSSNVVIVTMGRDALHRHVTDTVGTSVTDRLFSEATQLLETKAGSNTVTRNVWSPAYVDGMILRDRDTDSNGTLDERIYSLQDANWNTTALVNISGTVVERDTYSPFGVATYRDASGSVISTSAKDWVFLHQGGEKIAAGDYEFRNRVYSPTLGRWLSNDPLGFEAGNVNFYSAYKNSPNNETDPSGFESGSIPQKPLVPIPNPRQRKPIKYAPDNGETWNGIICLVANYEINQGEIERWIGKARNEFKNNKGVPIVWGYIGSIDDIKNSIKDRDDGSIKMIVIGAHGGDESCALNYDSDKTDGRRFGGVELVKNPDLCSLLQQKTSKDCIYRFEWCNSGENNVINKINAACLEREIIAANGFCHSWGETPVQYSPNPNPKPIPGGKWIHIPWPPKKQKD